MTPYTLRDGTEVNLETLQNAYRILPELVLKDLQVFCRAMETTFVADNARLSDVLEGRRQVWLRIQNFLELTSEQLMAIAKNTPLHTGYANGT